MMKKENKIIQARKVKKISLDLDNETYDGLVKLSKSNERSISYLIRQSIQNLLNNSKKVSK